VKELRPELLMALIDGNTAYSGRTQLMSASPLKQKTKLD